MVCMQNKGMLGNRENRANYGPAEKKYYLKTLYFFGLWEYALKLVVGSMHVSAE